jgi:DNA-binding NarL/FixJ family response regulator
MAPTVNVLLIDDSPDFAKMVRKWLSAKDDGEFILTWADSLTRGLKSLPNSQVDVILLDLDLPDSNGCETLRAVRAQDPAVPVIVLSANDGEPLTPEIEYEGAQDYINKSACNPGMLSRALHYETARSRATAARCLREKTAVL